MKSFQRICFLLSFVFIGIGFCLILVGKIGGGTIRPISFPISRKNTPVNESTNVVEEAIASTAYESDDIYSENNDIAIEYITEGTSRTLMDEYGIDSIYLDIAMGDVYVTVGDTFAIQTSKFSEDNLSTYIEETVLYIQSYADKKRSNLLGWDSNRPEIFITIPRDFYAQDLTFSIDRGSLSLPEISGERVELLVGAGQLIVDAITASEGYFEVGAGLLNIDKIDISEADFEVGTGQLEVGTITAYEGDFEVGAGQLIIHNGCITDISVDCGIGRMNYTGIIERDSSINCGVGMVDLNLDAEETNYNYLIDCGLGRVKLNQKHFNNADDKEINHVGAIGTMEIDCDLGTVAVYTQ